MTKKDYELIAKTIKEVRDFASADQQTINNIMMNLGAALYSDNNKFSMEKFIEACK